MANAIWSKDGIEFKETPDTPEFAESAKSKGYKRYYDITKDDKDVKTVSEDMLDTAKSKGYRIFGQPAIEQKPSAPAPAETAPAPAEEPGLLSQAGSWVGRAAKAGYESVKGIPEGVYQLGKEVVTQPGEAAGAALTSVGKTTGLYKLAAPVVGGIPEAAKAAISGEEGIGSAFTRGTEEAERAYLGEAERLKQTSPAVYGAAPYAATATAAALSGGAALPVMTGLEVATGAAQQLAETGKVDTAELAGQTAAGLGLVKGAQTAQRMLPAGLSKTAKEAKAKGLEEAAIKQAEEVGGIGDIAEKYTGEGAKERIKAAKRSGYEVGQAKSDYNLKKLELDNEYNAKAYEVDQRNAKLESDYANERARRAAEYNDLVQKIENERNAVGAVNEDKLAEYNSKLEAWTQESNRLEQSYRDAQQQYAIEKASYDKAKSERAKALDEQYLGAREKYYTEELPQYQEQRQKDLQAQEQAKQDYRMQVAEWQAQTKKAVNDLKAESSQLLKQSIEKAKEARRSVRGEAVTAMGDELRNMLDNMDQVQKEAYSARKALADADANVLESVNDSATSKAIFDVEQTLNSNYMMDEAIREDLKAIKMRVDPELQTSEVTRGTDFETLHELRIYLDNMNNALKQESRRIRDAGGSEFKDIARKRAAINAARQKIQQRLYGSDSVFPAELKEAGEAADGIYSEFRRAKGLMQQKNLLAKEKAVPGMPQSIEPRTNLIEDYFDEVDAGRKAEMRALLSDFGVDTAKLDDLENKVRLGVVPEPIAVQRLELPERPGIFTPPQATAQRPVPPTRPMASQYDIGEAKPIAPMKPAIPPKPARPALQAEPRIPKFVAPTKPIKEIRPSTRIRPPEEMQARRQLAEQQALSQEYKALGGKSTFDERGVPTTRAGLLERTVEKVGEAVGVGTTAMQKLERAAEIRATPVLFENLRTAFGESSNPIVMSLRVLTNQGVKITPTLIRTIARRNNVPEEDLAEIIMQSQSNLGGSQ